MPTREAGWKLFLLLIAISVLGAACAGEATKPSSSSSPSGTPSGQSAGTDEEPSRYVGPAVAFDVPDGWHEFYLEVPFDFFAAYGPVSGGDSDYVAVAPIPVEVEDQKAEDILEALIGSHPGIQIEVAETKDRTTFWAVMTEGDLTQQATIVERPSSRYLVTCQHSEAMAADVSAGCDSIIASVHDSTPSPVTDRSGCTDRELSLIASIALLEGAEPDPSAFAYPNSCDLQIELPSGSRDAIATLSTELLDAGWRPNEARIVRRSGPYDVWRLVADRDFDIFQIEAFIDGDITDRYFITVVDG